MNVSPRFGLALVIPSNYTVNGLTGAGLIALELRQNGVPGVSPINKDFCMNVSPRFGLTLVIPSNHTLNNFTPAGLIALELSNNGVPAEEIKRSDDRSPMVVTGEDLTVMQALVENRPLYQAAAEALYQANKE